MYVNSNVAFFVVHVVVQSVPISQWSHHVKDVVVTNQPVVL